MRARRARQNTEHLVNIGRIDDARHAHTHVERVEHVAVRDLASLLNQRENRQDVDVVTLDNDSVLGW